MTTYKKNRKIWFDALLSGDYKQGFGRLKNCSNSEGTTYCCIGVAADTLIKNFDKVYVISTDSIMGKGYLPICKKLGLSKLGRARLVHFNDNNGLSFKTIVKKIKKNPRRFFKEETL